ncbi:hypothetical protein [Actinoplanes couchii]|uniref:hypothetical protein n=1 Tax=Actinoplanes couchii TaxID=403638 RepID=UPI0035B54652
MSRSTFAESFKNQVGTTPLEYLIQWRMSVSVSYTILGVPGVSPPRGPARCCSGVEFTWWWKPRPRTAHRTRCRVRRWLEENVWDVVVPGT